MKYLFFILFLVPMVSYSEIRVEVSNSINGKMYSAVFGSQPEVDAWKSENVSNNSWGKPDRWERKVTTCPGAERTIGIAPNDYQECFYPVEYTITETDITADVQVDNDAKNARKLIIDGMRTKLGNNSNITLPEVIEYIKAKEGL